MNYKIDILKLEKEIIDFANNLLKAKKDKFKELDVIVKEYPKIDVWSKNFRNFVLYLWSDKKRDFLLIEFPTLAEKKPFCTLSEAQQWIEEDIKKFLNE